MKTPHEILGVAPNASEEEIKKAYRKKVFDTHPDRGGDPEKFKEVQSAYESLTNPQPSFNNAFTDIFDNFFSFRQGKQRGQDILSTCKIEFLESAEGCEKEITLLKPKNCTICKGTGAEELVSCSACQGQGMMSFRQGPMIIKRTCPSCYGKGKTIKKSCKSCHGGKINESVQIKVKIPAGINNGDKIRLPGHGEVSEIAGDAYVIIEVNPHELFYREEDDLIINVPITYAQVVLGDTIKVPWLKGYQDVTIPEHCDLMPIRVKGKGFRSIRNGYMGDLVVYLKVDTSPSSECLKLIKSLNNKEKKYPSKIIAEFGLKVDQLL